MILLALYFRILKFKFTILAFMAIFILKTKYFNICDSFKIYYYFMYYETHIKIREYFLVLIILILNMRIIIFYNSFIIFYNFILYKLYLLLLN